MQKKEEVQVWLFDIHEECKNKKAIDIAKQIIKKVKPNKIGFGGDETCYDGISKYTFKDPSYGVDTSEDELNSFKETYNEILKAGKLSEKDTIFTLGNHNGERVDKLLKKLKDKKLEREYRDVKRSLDFKVNFPKANVLEYGIPYRKNGLNIIHIEPNKCNGKHHSQSMAIEYGEDVLYGHHHTNQVFTLSQKVKTVRAVSSPCLCNLNPDYGKHSGNAWSNGFVVVTFYNNTYSLEVVDIKNNKAMFRGKLYTAGNVKAGTIR